MKFKMLFVGFILICFTSNLAFAKIERGDQLLWGLTGEDADEVKAVYMMSYSMGYVSGMIDSYRILSAIAPNIRFICLPV